VTRDPRDPRPARPVTHDSPGAGDDFVSNDVEILNGFDNFMGNWVLLSSLSKQVPLLILIACQYNTIQYNTIKLY